MYILHINARDTSVTNKLYFYKASIRKISVFELALAPRSMSVVAHYLGWLEHDKNNPAFSQLKNTKRRLKSILRHSTMQHIDEFELGFDSVVLQAICIKIKTAKNTKYNKEKLHDLSTMKGIPAPGTLVLVLGMAGKPPDVGRILRVNRSTVDIILTTSLCASEPLRFSVDFNSISVYAHDIMRSEQVVSTTR